MKPKVVTLIELLTELAIETGITAAEQGKSVIQEVDATFKSIQDAIPQAMFDGRHAGYPIEVAKYEARRQAEQQTGAREVASQEAGLRLPLDPEAVVERRQALSETIQTFAESINSLSPTFKALVASAEEQQRISQQQQNQQSPLFDIFKDLRPGSPVDQSEDRSNSQDNSLRR